MTEESMNTNMPAVQRAATALSVVANIDKLMAMSQSTASIRQITNKAGFAEADEGRKALKRMRIAITKRASEATEDAKAFVAAVREQAKALVAVIAPEEDRLAALTEEWSEKEARERAERERAERERVLAITTEINRIMSLPITLLGRRADEMRDAIASLSAIMITTESFGDFTENALEAKIASLDKIGQMLANQELVEEAARIKAAEDARRAEEEAKAAKTSEAPSAGNAPKEAGIVAAEEEAVLPSPPQVDPTVKWVDEPMPLADRPGPPESPVDEGGGTYGPARFEKPSDEEIIAALSERFCAPEREVVLWLVDMDISLALEKHRTIA